MSPYERFESLLKERKITPYKISKKTGVATSTLTSWKNGRYIPKADKLLKIANYLEIPVEELINAEVIKNKE